MPRKSVPLPRSWFRFDLDYLQQDTIRDLLDEFGPVGPLLFFQILCEAKKADLAAVRPQSQQGVLSARASALARTVGTDVETLWRLVSHAEGIGLLQVMDGTDQESGRLVARSLKRAAWEPMDANAASRQARKRQGSDPDEDYIDGM
jgi:hypothetical protein